MSCFMVYTEYFSKWILFDSIANVTKCWANKRPTNCNQPRSSSSVRELLSSVVVVCADEISHQAETQYDYNSSQTFALHRSLGTPGKNYTSLSHLFLYMFHRAWAGDFGTTLTCLSPDWSYLVCYTFILLRSYHEQFTSFLSYYKYLCSLISTPSR